MKKSIMIVAVVLVNVVVVGFVLLRFSEEEDSGVQVVSGKVVEFDIVAKQWEFVPALIEVGLGDRVKLHMGSEDVTHGFVIPELGVSERLELGEDVHVDFIADKAGIFNFYCNVPCGGGHGGMNGMIVVK